MVARDELLRRSIKDDANWRRERCPDTWDALLDTGKLKKVKEKGAAGAGQEEVGNPFQARQDRANADEEGRRQGKDVARKPYTAKRMPGGKPERGGFRGGRGRGFRGGFRGRGGRGGFRGRGGGFGGGRGGGRGRGRGRS